MKLSNLISLLIIINSVAFSQSKTNGSTVSSTHDSLVHIYDSKGELIVSKAWKDGLEQEGYIYKGERVNQTDQKGRKTGRWISFYQSNTPNKIDGIANLVNYDKNQYVDTGYFFLRSGVLSEIFIYGNDSILPKRIVYYSSGKISRIDYHGTDPKYGFVRILSIYFSDSIADCVIKKETYQNQNVNFIYNYQDCKLLSKTSVKESFKIIETETEETFYPPGINERPITYKTMTSVPFTESLPYTIESGEFDTTDTNLINGTISYYNEINELIKTKKVLNGLIIEE